MTPFASVKDDTAVPPEIVIFWLLPVPIGASTGVVLEAFTTPAEPLETKMVVPPEAVKFDSPVVGIADVDGTIPLPIPPVELAVLVLDEIVPTKLPTVPLKAELSEVVTSIVISVVILAVMVVSVAEVLGAKLLLEAVPDMRPAPSDVFAVNVCPGSVTCPVPELKTCVISVALTVLLAVEVGL
jgi:hypothetical protein